MRDELKLRETELEKSLEDKQQLNNQVQNLKEGLQNLQNTHAMEVSLCFCFDGTSDFGFNAGKSLEK